MDRLIQIVVLLGFAGLIWFGRNWAIKNGEIPLGGVWPIRRAEQPFGFQVFLRIWEFLAAIAVAFAIAAVIGI